ncbi:MAG TPA: LLM class F420-dependent oxidoreductase, partial [Solirubrobacteraceae bacterium]|nr:LLM class F420-dependent oxidoreductase [Solirubrobacteraceae bacterium]
LNAATKRGEWDKLSQMVDDEVLNTFAIIGTPEEAVAELKRRYGDVVTRITLDLSPDLEPEGRAALLEELRAPA